jgi:predicted metal-binding protein
VEEKRVKFERIAQKQYFTACGYCSGDQGTEDTALRFPAAEQLK